MLTKIYIYIHLPYSIFRAGGKNYHEEKISEENAQLNEAPQVCLKQVFSFFSAQICISQIKKQIDCKICNDFFTHTPKFYLSILKLASLGNQNQLQSLQTCVKRVECI